MKFPMEMQIEVQCFQMEDFAKWLEEKLREREWQASDLARRANLGNSTISRILDGIRGAGPDVCLAIAKALDEPPEKVFRLAGILPPILAGDDVTLRDLVDLARMLPAEERLEILRYADYRYKEYKRQHGREDRGKNESASVET